MNHAQHERRYRMAILAFTGLLIAALAVMWVPAFTHTSGMSPAQRKAVQLHTRMLSVPDGPCICPPVGVPTGSPRPWRPR
jgi:uncharacterized integral membrane protein